MIIEISLILNHLFINANTKKKRNQISVGRRDDKIIIEISDSSG